MIKMTNLEHNQKLSGKEIVELMKESGVIALYGIDKEFNEWEISIDDISNDDECIVKLASDAHCRAIHIESDGVTYCLSAEYGVFK